MKIAVLADIHGNMTALQAVIDYVEARGIEKYIIAGDHISDCPNPNQVIEKISTLKGWIIRGNREEYILEFLDKDSTDWKQYKQLDSLRWTCNNLKNHNVDYIRKLPAQESVRFNNLDSIRVVHGSTDDIYEHLYPHKVKRLHEIARSIDENVLVCGHTHEPWSKRIDNKLIVNPGSVGVSFNSESAAEFSILSWEADGWRIEHHRAKYDLCELEAEFEENGLYEEGGIWPNLILQSLKDGVNRNIEFIKLAKANAKALGYFDYNYIPNEIWAKTEKQWVFTALYEEDQRKL